MVHGVQVSDIFNTLQVYLGSYYVNNFNEYGRTWQVNVQADPRFRDDVDGDPPACRSATAWARWSAWARCWTCATRAGR